MELEKLVGSWSKRGREFLLGIPAHGAIKQLPCINPILLLSDGEALGVLADTTQRCEIDLRKESNIKIIAPLSYPLITFGPFASPTDVLMSFALAVVSKMAKNKGTTCSKVQSSEMLHVPILEKGVFRFDCSAHDRNNALPSISFKDPKCRDKPITNCNVNPTYIPTFERVNEVQRVNIELPSGTSFYGTGEVSGQLERTGKRIFTWNTDAYGYGAETTSLYQSHPWVLAVLHDGKALGVLVDTTRGCEIDLSKESNIKIIAPTSYPLITFGPLDSPADVLRSFSRAVGTVFMPPKWSLGYQQSRWSYDSDARVREIARTFREKKIPCDVIWMDIDYMDGYRCFTFDKDRFSDPKSLADYLHQNGFKANWMLDPGIKRDDGYFVYDSGSKRDIWTQTACGEPFVGKVWPGPCVFPDFTKSEARSWWASLVKDFVTNGVDGLWNDMNEPAVKTVTKTMPESNIHRGDPEYGGKQNHSHYHNVYGMLMARSTYEGMKLANEQKRPFVLTRAGFVGSQRYAATWTGDNTSNWEHLRMSIPMVLNLGLSGQPFSGPDIGGFIGNATSKLFRRWMGVGAMFPFCRGHSAKPTTDHEPWSFGEECEEVCRLALRRRYQLLPHMYNLFYLAHTTGIPVATPTFFTDPKDIELRKQDNSFLLGPVLVYASTSDDTVSNHQLLRKLPKGIWMSFDFEDYHPDLPSLYLKGGSIIPLAPPYQHVGEAKREDDITLLVALDEHGKAEGFLYEDAGDGYEYLKGEYLLTTYAAELQSSVVTLTALKTEGSWNRPKRRLNVKLLICVGAVLDAWGIDGEVVQIKFPMVVGAK